MDMYRDIILDHYRNPRNFGHLKKPDSIVTEGNVTCGDRICMEIRVSKESTSIGDIRFSGEGCAISQASASMLTQKAINMKCTDIMELSAKDVIDMLGTDLTPSRVKCAVLPLEVLQKAIIKLPAR